MEKATKKTDIKKLWHLIDAKNQVLGRLATSIAPLLIGKNKPYFVRHLDCGDYVVVVNAKYIRISGRKGEQKHYSSYSGYPGGLKLRSYSQLRQDFPEKIIVHAVSGMLPKNKLQNSWLKRLYVFPESDHNFGDKFSSEKITKAKESKKSEKGKLEDEDEKAERK